MTEQAQITRLKQRLENYQKAIGYLQEDVAFSKKKSS